MRLFLLLFLFPTLSIADNGIERTKSEDGTVEFSNVSPAKKKKPVKTTVIYKYSESDDVTVFTNKKPSHITEFEVLKYDCYACNPDSKIDWYRVRLNPTSFSDAVSQAAKKHQVDPALIRALMHAESAFNPNAVSHKGAQGLMQLMPGTAKELGVQDALIPSQNIAGGAKYIAQLLKRFNGNIQLATAAYNAGPGAVKKYNGVPPYKETEVYVERVGILHKRYQMAL
ncbi:MAG: lytic transglycosylase domain-containing protein [Piscirickettsiaceae bacterium]|nr:lytic transglycosylase domain-containing protein [Piscirickettsiaceae bacterium]